MKKKTWELISSGYFGQDFVPDVTYADGFNLWRGYANDNKFNQ